MANELALASQGRCAESSFEAINSARPYKYFETPMLTRDRSDNTRTGSARRGNLGEV